MPESRVPSRVRPPPQFYAIFMCAYLPGACSTDIWRLEGTFLKETEMREESHDRKHEYCRSNVALHSLLTGCSRTF